MFDKRIRTCSGDKRVLDPADGWPGNRQTGELTSGDRASVRVTGRPFSRGTNARSKSDSSSTAWPCLPALAVRPTLWMYWSRSAGSPICQTRNFNWNSISQLNPNSNIYMFCAQLYLNRTPNCFSNQHDCIQCQTKLKT